jgi:hypothetical protein
MKVPYLALPMDRLVVAPAFQLKLKNDRLLRVKNASVAKRVLLYSVQHFVLLMLLENLPGVVLIIYILIYLPVCLVSIVTHCLGHSIQEIKFGKSVNVLLTGVLFLVGFTIATGSLGLKNKQLLWSILVYLLLAYLAYAVFYTLHTFFPQLKKFIMSDETKPKKWVWWVGGLIVLSLIGNLFAGPSSGEYRWGNQFIYLESGGDVELYYKTNGQPHCKTRGTWSYSDGHVHIRVGHDNSFCDTFHGTSGKFIIEDNRLIGPR